MLCARNRFQGLLASCLGFVLLQGGAARAASFEINPVRVSLSASTSSGLIAVRNLSTEPLRFQAMTFAWAQGTSGEMQLTPTEEIVVYPTIFTIKPGEARNMRVGTVAPPGAVETAYRVFVNELPPLQSAATGSAVRVLTRMGIPVFVSPPAPKAGPQIDGISFQGGRVVFAVRNVGNAFFMGRQVRISGLAADGSTVFTRDLPSWYVLAGGLRAYSDALPSGACAAERLQIAVETEATTVQTWAPLPQGACTR
jgi:fimbrial chaperone protein